MYMMDVKIIRIIKKYTYNHIVNIFQEVIMIYFIDIRIVF